MTKEEMIIAAERYAHEQTGRDCRWADCEFCWVYRSDVPCKHREIMIAKAIELREADKR
jgi:hypothetical protein